MVNNTKSFQIREIDTDKWNNLVNNIDRRVFDKNKKLWDNRNLEEYFKALIYKLSKLPKDSVNKIVENEVKIKIE